MNSTRFSFLAPLLLGILSISCHLTATDLTDLDEENTVASLSARGENIRMNRSPLNPKLLYEETLEESKPFNPDNQNSLGTWEYAIRYVDKPVFQGEKSVRFEIREAQPLVQGGKRAEVVIVKGAEKEISRDAWYSFAVYFPSNGYEYDNDREIINQWFQDGTPATSMRTQRDRFLLETGNKILKRYQYDLGPIEKDRWHEFVFHFIHDDDSHGLIEIWHDGELVLKRKGGNMYPGRLPKWKIGLYKATFKYGTSNVTRRVIYFDNIRVGSHNATFEDMTSLYKTLPPPPPDNGGDNNDDTGNDNGDEPSINDPGTDPGTGTPLDPDVDDGGIDNTDREGGTGNNTDTTIGNGQ
ncbi:polysaccharide lyase [Paraflavisolibacter sp. H34]|uniref:polysaccharide lyase n=1 Tax=Huijunlia imazamoxiresistens TaxID=3127457 RepID=UPI003016B275